MAKGTGFGPAWEYWTDALQRAVLFMDTLRERGNVSRERAKEEIPHVLQFGTELVRDGRTLPRPVNYGLVRIVPPDGEVADLAKPPILSSIRASATGPASVA